jgi:hypothetical protein
MKRGPCNKNCAQHVLVQYIECVVPAQWQKAHHQHSKSPLCARFVCVQRGPWQWPREIMPAAWTHTHTVRFMAQYLI